MSTLVSTGGPEHRPTGLAAAFAVALLLHGAALVGIAYYRLSPPAPPGQNEITIDLAPQMAETETQAPSETLDSSAAPAETVPTEAPPEEATKPPETAAEVAPQETVAETPPAVALTQPPPDAMPVEPESQVITSTAPQAEPLAPPPPVTAVSPEPPKPVEQAKPQPDPAKLQAEREAKRKAALEAKRKEELEERREEQREKIAKERREAKAKAARDARVRAEAESRGSSTRQQAAASRQSSAGGQASRGNDPNALAQWKGMLGSAIRGRMNRNAAAGTAGGVATVRFTVSRSGQVLSAGLAGSSGVGAIDSAALAAVRGSLPPAPAGFTQPSLSVTVPMRFSPGG